MIIYKVNPKNQLNEFISKCWKLPIWRLGWCHGLSPRQTVSFSHKTSRQPSLVLPLDTLFLSKQFCTFSITQHDIETYASLYEVFKMPDPLSSAGIAIGAASLTIQVFDGCLKGAEIQYNFPSYI